MKLYQSKLSPYSCRCRIQIYAKGIEGMEYIAAPGGLASDEFKKINPSGKIPALEVDGRVLGESGVICEYLEDRFPSPSLRPEDAFERAQVRQISQLADFYILGPLFVMLPMMNPADRVQNVIDDQLALLKKHFALLEKTMTDAGYDDGSYAVGDGLTLADCALVPALFVVVNILPAFGMATPLEATPKLGAYWQAILKDEYCARVHEEMVEGLNERTAGG
jgi:glutathione S-transferase